jgi:Zn finger protein HypA/HybF involved in hydrogenase expression
MHEVPLTQNLLDHALKAASSKPVVRANLLIGPFSEEREESIRFYWRDLGKCSCGEGVELHFEHIPLAMKCLTCSGAFYLDEGFSMCKYGYDEGLQVLNREDVQLKSIVVE